MRKTFHLTNSLNLKLMILLTTIMTVQSFIQFDVKTGIITFIPSFAVILLMVFVMKKVKNQEHCAMAISLILMTGVLGFVVATGGANHAVLLVCGTVVMCALYFNEKVIRNYSILVNVVMYTLYLVFKINILEDGAYIGTFFTHTLILMIVEVGLYNVVSWTNRSFEETQRLLEKVQNTVAIVEESTEILTESVGKLETIAYQTNDISEMVGKSMEEINGGIKVQSDSMYCVNDSIYEVRKEAEKTKEISRKNESLTYDLSIKTSENLDGINSVENQIELIRNVMDNTTLSVDDFEKSTEDIISVLKGIKDISEQTTLLALNASIEAARAGIHGRGFSVVAEEVVKLSIESNDVVSDVEKLIFEMREKLENLSVRVKSGCEAVENGKDIIKKTRISFTEMNNIFNNTKKNISDEYDHIGSINLLIDNVDNNVNEMNETIEKSSVTTQKVTGIQEEQQTHVAELLESLKYIQEQIHNLKNIL